MKKLSLQDLDVNGKRVLMRVDFNVPLGDDGSVRDDTRIRGALQSIRYVREHGGTLILMSHLGRPRIGEGNKVGEDNSGLTMDAVADRLRNLVGGNVTKSDNLIGPDVEAAVAELNAGDVLLLENTRFHPGETKNDPELAAALARLGDLYVSDAFGALHRAHASTVGVAEHFEQRAAGFLVAKEIEFFGRILESPDRPLAAILGGAKVSDKIPVIDNLLDLVDILIIGGGMAYTFIKAQGHEIGDSLFDEAGFDRAKAAITKAREKGVELLLPVDTVVADAFSATANHKTVAIDSIEPGWMGLDIGQETVAFYYDSLGKARTVVWNGPLGVFEMEPYSNGTRSVADALAKGSAVSVIGGGDTAAAVAQFGLADKMSHVSTGGGASLEMLEGKELPGLAVLTDA